MTRHRPALPAPGRSRDVDLGPAVETARRLLHGVPGAGLLAEVSVARAAALLAECVREPADWLRTLVETLNAFRALHPSGQLAPVLSASWADPAHADQVMVALAQASAGVATGELARRGFGPKLWFTANGVAVTWRPLPTTSVYRGAASVPPAQRDQDGERQQLAVRALIDAGLTTPEVRGLRLSDLGRLAPGGVFVPDVLAEPLAIRYVPDGGGPGRLTFLAHEGRIAVLAAVLARHAPDVACRRPDEPLIGTPDPRGVLPAPTL